MRVDDPQPADVFKQLVASAHFSNSFLANAPSVASSAIAGTGLFRSADDDDGWTRLMGQGTARRAGAGGKAG
jgi:hypothetical protein